MGCGYFSANTWGVQPKPLIWSRYLRTYLGTLLAGGSERTTFALPETRITTSPASSVLRCSSTLGFARTWRALRPGAGEMGNGSPSQRNHQGTAWGLPSGLEVTNQITRSLFSSS